MEATLYVNCLYFRCQPPGGRGNQERPFRFEHEAHQATAQTERKRGDAVCRGLPRIPAEVRSYARQKIQKG